MNKIQEKILSRLIEQYEKSLTFSGKNKVHQTFSVHIEKIFPKYADNAEYDFYKEVNEELDELERKNFISLQKEPSGKITRASLNDDDEILQAIYKNLKKIPRKTEQAKLLEILENTESVVEPVENTNPLQKYIESQKERIKQNKNVEYFSGDLEEFSDILKAAHAVLQNENEIFIRDFSIQLFGDSKRFEKIQNSVVSLISKYGGEDFVEKENLLSSFGIVKTPTYVCVKGNAVVFFVSEENSQKLDLSKFKGDIAFSTETLKEITSVKVNAKKIVTVENLTSFHDYKNKDDFVIYLGGFHNKTKREFIKKVYVENPEKKYLHFGDIDAGGFYILEHLKRKTGIDFKPMNMDIATLKKYSDFTKPLTKEDVHRLSLLQKNPEYEEVVSFMIEHNCKLEQEAEL